MAFNFSSFDVKLNSTSNDALYMDVGRHLIVSIRKNVIRAPRGNWLKNKSRNGNGGSFTTGVLPLQLIQTACHTM